IAERHAEQRPMAIKAVRNAPLIVIGTSKDCGACGIEPAAAGVIPGDGEREVRRFHRCAGSI
ncbi:hypothetical protein, partial [Shewanella algae]|uniref:hypothetical protein n=1 Tax=Shewanella algae TaxID=38313 RepID=UPI00313EDC01